MKFLWMILLLIISPSLIASEFISTIHSINYGKSKQPHLIRFDNGRVIFVKSMDKDLISSFVTTAKNKNVLLVKTYKNNFAKSFQTLAQDVEEVDSGAWSDDSKHFNPSIVKNTNVAKKIFNRMRKDYTKKGECYSRAHVWAYEEYQRSGLKSMKIFMFFTERYIRKYKFHWWFHVTPAIYVGKVKSPRTLDRRYTSGPRQTKTWSDVFVKTKRSCKKVQKFDDYWLNQKIQDCYHIRASMYYVIPRDLEKRDITGKEKTEFSERELKRAYRNGFNKNRL